MTGTIIIGPVTSSKIIVAYLMLLMPSPFQYASSLMKELKETIKIFLNSQLLMSFPRLFQ
jgi:hypothetical protein